MFSRKHKSRRRRAKTISIPLLGCARDQQRDAGASSSPPSGLRGKIVTAKQAPSSSPALLELGTPDLDKELLEGCLAKKNPHPINVVVVGDKDVGKSKALLSYTRGPSYAFPQLGFTPSVFDDYCEAREMLGVSVRLSLWGTSGQEDSATLRPLCYAGTDVFVVCFSLNDVRSFKRVKSLWVPEIRHHCPEVPFVLAGSKLDVASDQQARSVTEEEAWSMAKELGAACYIPFSARTQCNLALLFEEAVKAALRRIDLRRPTID